MFSTAVERMMRRKRQKGRRSPLFEFVLEPALLLIVLLPGEHKASWQESA